jgi:hypothetical protein
VINAVVLLIGLLILRGELRMLRLGVEWCDRTDLRDGRQHVRLRVALALLITGVLLLSSPGVPHSDQSLWSWLTLALWIVSGVVFVLVLVVEFLAWRRITARHAALEPDNEH